MSGTDRDLAISLNRTSYVSSKYGIATFRGIDYNKARIMNSDMHKYEYRGKTLTFYYERGPIINKNDFYSLEAR